MLSRAFSAIKFETSGSDFGFLHAFGYSSPGEMLEVTEAEVESTEGARELFCE